jgi:UDP-glucose 4-epimerase
MNIHGTNVEFIVGELNELEHFLPLVKRSRAVIHTASRSTPGSSAGQAITEMQNNLRPTLALLQALQLHPETNLLYLSSGGSLYATAPDEFATETSPISPRSYHGAGKIAAEHFIGAWCCQYGGCATVLRPSNIYGPCQKEHVGFGIVPTGLGKIRSEEVLPVWGDGSAIRDYLYIDDFVALCVSILARPMRGGSLLLNASSGVGVSLNELFTIMEAVTGQSLKRSYDIERAVDAPRIVMASALARELCGWSSTTSLHEGIQNTWAWLNSIQP